jgi:hypothetical protein
VVRRVAVVALVAACGDPTPFPCDVNSDCVAGGVAGVCADAGFCAFGDTSCASGLRYDDSAGALAGVCVGGGTSPLGDSPDMPVMLGDTQQFDLSAAHDDYSPSCTGSGGADVFLETTLDQPSRLYVDTLGTDFHVAIAVLRGPCASLGTEIDCVSASCSDQFQHWTSVLQPGTYCVVADQFDDSETNTKLVVRSMRGPPAPLGTLGTNTADTCDGTDWVGACSPDAPEQTWFFMSCAPATYTATTCSSDPSFNGDLQAWGLANAPLACSSPCPGIQAPLVEPGGVWIVVEAASFGSCGSIDVDIGQQ